MRKRYVAVFLLESLYIFWLAYLNYLKMQGDQNESFLRYSLLFAPVAVGAIVYLFVRGKIENDKSRWFALSLFLGLNILYSVI